MRMGSVHYVPMYQVANCFSVWFSARYAHVLPGVAAME